MRVQFTHNQEEIVDALARFNARSRVMNEMQRGAAIWVALVAGVIVFLLFRFSGTGLIAGAATAGICILVYPWFYRRQQRNTLRKFVKESYGDENEFACSVEILPEGLKANYRHVEWLAPWETLEEVVATSDSVDIFSPRGFIVVRDRAFSSAAERQQFIELVQASIDQARRQKKP